MHLLWSEYPGLVSFRCSAKDGEADVSTVAWFLSYLRRSINYGDHHVGDPRIGPTYQHVRSSVSSCASSFSNLISNSIHTHHCPTHLHINHELNGNANPGICHLPRCKGQDIAANPDWRSDETNIRFYTAG